MDRAGKKENRRHWFQLAFAAVTNGYAAGFAKGTIYTGHAETGLRTRAELLFLPRVHLAPAPSAPCKRCSTAGSLSFSYYVFGFLIAFGALLGRFVCGWLCPFGLIQEALYKIPFFKKLRVLPGDRALRLLKYVILALFVLLLPMVVTDFVGQGQPWFCKYICPAGTLEAGLPLAIANPGVRAAVGALFWWKVGLLAAIVLLSLLVYRPFCRYLCPLGAIYGLFNPLSLYRYRVDAQRCTHCGKCARGSVLLAVEPYKTPNSPECIRCGACRSACPTSAIQARFYFDPPCRATGGTDMKSDFGLAIHALVALDHAKATLSSEQLARTACTNPARLRRILSRLRAAGLISAKEGPAGGYTLLRDADGIPLSEILSAMQTDLIAPTYGGTAMDAGCIEESGMAEVMEDLARTLNAACMDSLRAVTLADISERVTCPVLS